MMLQSRGGVLAAVDPGADEAIARKPLTGTGPCVGRATDWEPLAGIDRTANRGERTGASWTTDWEALANVSWSVDVERPADVNHGADVETLAGVGWTADRGT